MTTERFQSDNFSFARFGSLFVILHGKVAPTPTEWSSYVQALERAVKRNEPFQTLVFTDGAAPSKAQRDAIAPLLKGRRVVVVTSSATTRFVISSLALIGMKIRSASPEQWRDAFTHFQSSAEERATGERALTGLAQSGFAPQIEVWTAALRPSRS